jgi:uncharacterized protein YidB (DUF937 family)
MGLLDDIVGGVIGSGRGGQQTSQPSNPLAGLLGGLGGQQGRGGDILSGVLSMVQQNGGLSGVLEMFRGQGMAREADSWVSTGPNADISASQIEQVFSGKGLGHLATQLGTSRGEASSMLAQVLPELVNQLTPQGQVPEDSSDLLSRGLSLLRGQGT